MLTHNEPPGYRQRQPRGKPALEPFLPIIHEIFESDKQVPKKQRHMAARIFHRLRDEHGYSGGYTSVRTAIREWKRKTQEVFLPLSCPPGQAQVDFGYAYVDLAGEREQVALFVMTLPYGASRDSETVVSTSKSSGRSRSSANGTISSGHRGRKSSFDVNSSGSGGG